MLRRSVQNACCLLNRVTKSQYKRCLSTVVDDKERFIPRRACLYVPGNDTRKIEKAAGINLDSVVLDCEDGVAATKKDEARQNIRAILDSDLDWGRTDLGVRLNSVESGVAELDFDTIFDAKRLPSTVYLPKVESVDHVTWLVDHVNHRLTESKATMDRELYLILYVESALGLVNLKEILSHAAELSAMSRAHLDGVVFGSDDYCASIGAVRTAEGKEVLTARQQVVMMAKAFKIQAIDMVYIDFKDDIGLRKQCEEGAAMGFNGKQVIHPGQVPIVQQAFSPSPERVQWARELLVMFDEHTKSGKGAFTFRDQMIDMPTVLQARNIVQLDDAIKGTLPPRPPLTDENAQAEAPPKPKS